MKTVDTGMGFTEISFKVGYGISKEELAKVLETMVTSGLLITETKKKQSYWRLNK